MPVYTIELEHSRRRALSAIVRSDAGPMVPPLLEIGVYYSHVIVSIDDTLSDHAADQLARDTAALMHSDRPGMRCDMVTAARIISIEI